MKTCFLKSTLVAFLCLGMLTASYVWAQPSPSGNLFNLQDSTLSIPDIGTGITLQLPPNATVILPSEIQSISTYQITLLTLSAEQRKRPVLVEIYAERIPDNMSHKEWRKIQELIGTSYEIEEVSNHPITVAGYSGTFRQITSPDGVIWETEIFVGQVVYRISGLDSPEMERLYGQVLAGLQFTGSNNLPVNELPSIEEMIALTQHDGESIEVFPNLKFPFNGTKTITCAYYPDDHNCHAQTIYALDFSLNYEAVRAAHSGSLTRFSDACGGTQMKIVNGGDSSYSTYYSHLSRYMGNTGSVTQGQYIARSGATGSCQTGPHLHFLLNKSGANIKPEPMCGQTGFARYQTKTDCWSSSEKFASGSYTQLTITTSSVNLKVCGNNSGRIYYVSMWRPAVNGNPEKSWLVQQSAINGCVNFNDLDGPGDTFTGVYYYTNVALRSIPSDLAGQGVVPQTSCASSSGYKLFCDRVKR